MKRNPVLNDDDGGDDPMEMVANLFDAAMVFAVALMVAMVAHFNMGELLSGEDFTLLKNPGADNMEMIVKHNGRIERYVPSDTDSPTGGSRGRRVGTAYQLENGEIIYVPE